MSSIDSNSDSSIISIIPATQRRISMCRSVDPYASMAFDSFTDKGSLITISSWGKHTMPLDISGYKKAPVEEITREKCNCQVI